MKYRQLTKEQFEALNVEFSQFLATQQIDVKEWETLKKDKPEVAEEELNIFSDLVWDDVLTKASYVEHVSENHINLFKCNSQEIIRLFILCKNKDRSFLNDADFNWFLENPKSDDFEFFKASKKYESNRNKEIFKLIEMGGHISKGDLFNAMAQLIL